VEDAVDGDGKVVDLDLAEVIGVDVLVAPEERSMINVMVETF
jgi:hypothetical protein